MQRLLRGCACDGSASCIHTMAPASFPPPGTTDPSIGSPPFQAAGLLPTSPSTRHFVCHAHPASWSDAASAIPSPASATPFADRPHPPTIPSMVPARRPPGEHSALSRTRPTTPMRPPSVPARLTHAVPPDSRLTMRSSEVGIASSSLQWASSQLTGGGTQRSNAPASRVFLSLLSGASGVDTKRWGHADMNTRSYGRLGGPPCARRLVGARVLNLLAWRCFACAG